MARGLHGACGRWKELGFWRALTAATMAARTGDYVRKGDRRMRDIDDRR